MTKKNTSQFGVNNLSSTFYVLFGREYAVILNTHTHTNTHASNLYLCGSFWSLALVNGVINHLGIFSRTGFSSLWEDPVTGSVTAPFSCADSTGELGRKCFRRLWGVENLNIFVLYSTPQSDFWTLINIWWKSTVWERAALVDMSAGLLLSALFLLSATGESLQV